MLIRSSRGLVSTFHTAIRIGGSNGDSERIEDVEVLVDTGALHSMFPASLLEHLALSTEWHETFFLADGSGVRYGVGYAMLYIGPEHRRCPVIFGVEDEYLLGATTLEIFNLAADPVNETPVNVLRRARPI